MAKSSNYWVKLRYEKEVRVYVASEAIAKAKAMHDFLNELPNISEKDLRIMYVETSEDRK
jgi:hypothetical protein